MNYLKIESFNQRTLNLNISFTLFLIVLIGSALRLVELSSPPLWLDELFSMNGSDPTQSLRDVYEYAKADQPPVFFVVLFYWLKLFGYTEVAGRLLVTVFGILGIIAIYFLGKEVKNERLGLLVALMVSVNHFHASFSREIRFYPLVFLLSTLSFLSFIRIFKFRKVGDYILYIITTSLLLNTHYYGLVVFGSQLLVFIILSFYYKKDLAFIGLGLLSGLVTGLSLLHWLPVILKDLQIPNFHVAPVGLLFPAKFIWIYYKEIGSLILVAASLAMLIRLIWRTGQRTSIEYLIVLGWVTFGFGIPLLYSWIKMPLLTPKYSTITLPALFILVGIGFLEIEWRFQRVLLLLVIAGSLLTFLWIKPLTRPKRTEDWKQVAMFFKSHVKNNPTILAQLAYFHQFYFRSFGYAGRLPIDQRFCECNAMIKDSEQLWLLEHDRYPDDGLLPDQAQIIDSLFIPIDTVRFDETVAIRYSKK